MDSQPNFPKSQGQSIKANERLVSSPLEGTVYTTFLLASYPTLNSLTIKKSH